MKRILLTLMVAASSTFASAQAPEKFNYQAVARNLSGAALPNRTISIEAKVLNNAMVPIYTERFVGIGTNNIGLFKLEIGGGSVVSGTFSAIDWSASPVFLEIGLDENGGTNFMTTGTSQFLSVPYALMAKDVANNDDADADPQNELQNLSVAGDTLKLSNSNQVVIPNDHDWVVNGNDLHNYTPGNVGINTNLPTANLDVDSTARIRSLSPGGVVWADSLGNLQSLGNGNPMEQLVSMSPNGPPTWSDSTVYATTGVSYVMHSLSVRNAWTPGLVNLTVPEDGVYLILYNARVYGLQTNDGNWSTRLVDVTTNTVLGTFHGITMPAGSSNGDTGSSGSMIASLHQNDLLRLEYFVGGSGTIPYGTSLASGGTGIHIVRLGK